MPALTENDDDNSGNQGNPEELVIVETPPNEDGGNKDDARLNGNDDEGDGHNDGNDAEREAIRERRRKEKAERKERREQAISRDKLELNFLRQRNDDLERRLGSVEQHTHQASLSSFDAQIAQARNEAEMAERVIAKAVAAGNGDDVTQAMRYRDQAMQKAQQLTFAKQQAAQQRPAQQPEGLDNMTAHYVKEFMAENPWYDIKGNDEDSAIVLAIDGALHREGFRPDTEEYWDELRDRAARRLPERFNAAGTGREPQRQQSQQQPARTPRGGPAVGSGREHAPTSTRTEVYISPERKQALIDAGVWDDPVLRMKYVKRYSEYDKNNRA